MTKLKYCLFCYPTKASRAAGEMAHTIDAESIEEAGETAQEELNEGMYCVSVWERMPYAAPMQFVEAHVQPALASSCA